MKNSDLLKEIVSIASVTETPGESRVEEFIRDEMSGFAYFKQNPDLFGLEAIPGDKHGRGVNWGLVKGGSKETIIMINHHDVVATEDYGTLKEFAFDTDELARRMAEAPGGQSQKKDLQTREWMVGRGTADMKAGLVIQLEALKRYSEKQSRGVNLLYLSVPDEENASLGMRYGTVFIDKLKELHSLDYILAVNSESHERKDSGSPIIHTGSAGKFMLCVHVKGKQAHLGEVLKGFNPLRLLSRIAVHTDINFDLSDGGLSQLVPPPGWSYLRDNKPHYDASIPDSASGLFCFLSAKASAEQMLYAAKGRIEEIAREDMAQHLEAVLSNRTREGGPQDTVATLLYSELLAQAEAVRPGTAQEERERLFQAAGRGDASYFDATRDSIQRLTEYVNFEYPVVVLAVVPPYYPAVTSGLDQAYNQLLSHLSQKFHTVEEPFYLGISDLSYVTRGSQDDSRILKENMPLWDHRIYSIAFEILNNYHLDILNIGPWGKDLHQPSERVYIPDVDETIPKIYEELIESFNAKIAR